MKSLLSVRECTKHCENRKTNSPRNHWDHEIIWKHDPSRPTHSFQCGNSWFFLSTHREWQNLYELDMGSMKWADVKKLESPYGYYTTVGTFAVVSDGNESAYQLGVAEGYLGDVYEFNSLEESREEWNFIDVAAPFHFSEEKGDGEGEYTSVEYCRTSTMDQVIDDTGPYLVAFGGINGLYRFDVRLGSWRKLNSAVEPSSRGKSTLVHLASQQKLLMYGGAEFGDLWTNEACGSTLDDLWTFDLSKESRGWQKVNATGRAPGPWEPSCPKSVVVIRGSEPKILVLQESEPTKTTRTNGEILFYILDCLTLQWTMLNSHIRMDLNFASIFQPKKNSTFELVSDHHFYLYLAPYYGKEQIYSVVLKSNEMPQRLYQASLDTHLCDISIQTNSE